jgi:hypothetical protein
MHRTVIASLAILKVNWDAGGDYIENFVPFVAECLRTAAQPEVSWADLQRAVTEDFGLSIPQGALSTILRRAARRGYVQRTQGIWRRNDQALAKVGLTRARDDAVRKYEGLIAKLTGFCRERFGVEWSPEEAGAALLAYLEQGATGILAAAVNGRLVPPPKRSIPHAEFLVGAFVTEMCERDPEGFDFLETIAKGSMLASVLLFPDLGAVERHFERVEVYFDTGFVLQALGLQGESRAAPRRELLDLLYEQNASLRVFEHTLDEIRNVLNAAAHALRNRDNLRRAYGPTLQYFIDLRYSASDVDLISARLEKSLRAHRIGVKPKPPHTERLGVDEVKLEAVLREEVGYHREDTLHNDVDSLTAIHRLRGGELHWYVESCRALFVTTNHSLARASARFLREEWTRYQDGMAPHCLLDHVFTTLVWLKKPLKARDLPRKRVIADCYAAMNPPTSLWKRYLEEIDQLEKQGDISEEDYHLLRYSVAAKNALMDRTFGAADAFAEGTVAEVLAAAEAATRAQTEAVLRAEVAAREAVERKAADAERQAAEAASRFEARRQAQLDRVRSVGTTAGRWVARVASVIALGLVTLAAYLALLLPDLPGGWWTPVVTALAVGFVALGIANLAFGATISSITRGLEVAVSGLIERTLVRLIES